MQFVRTEMCVTLRYRQTLVPQQVCYVFERRSLHSQPTRKRVTQVVPVKVSELRFSIIEPMTDIFKRLARFHRRKDSSITSPISNTVVSALIAASFNGTCNGSSFSVRGM